MNVARKSLRHLLESYVTRVRNLNGSVEVALTKPNDLTRMGIVEPDTREHGLQPYIVPSRVRESRAKAPKACGRAVST